MAAAVAVAVAVSAASLSQQELQQLRTCRLEHPQDTCSSGAGLMVALTNQPSGLGRIWGCNNPAAASAAGTTEARWSSRRQLAAGGT